MKHIAIMALGSLGDVAMMVPVVKALRERDEALKITFLVRRSNVALVKCAPGAVALTVDKMSVGGMFHLWWRCVRTGVDGLVDLTPGRWSGLVCTLASATGIHTVRLAVDRNAIGELTRRVNKHFHPLTPISELACEAMARLGLDVELPVTVARPRMPFPPEVSLLAGEKRGRWIGVAPFARHKGKIYPMPLMSEVLELLAGQYERIFILGAGDVARLFGEGMERRIRGVVSVVGRLDLSDELSLLANLDVAVTMDSASMHLAAMLGVPVVSIWGPTHPYEGFYGFGLRSEWAVQHNFNCRPCSAYGKKPCIWRDYRCLERIKPAEIIAAVERALADAGRNLVRRRKKS